MSDSIHLRLEEMQKRVVQDRVSGSAGDRELTEKKQHQIIEGASSVLFEKGFHRTSIRDIATACGMSMGQLYHYISSKDDILHLIHKHSQGVWYQHLVDAGFEQVADPVERPAYALRGSISFVFANKDVFLALRGWNLDSTKVSEEIDFLVQFTFRGLGLKVPNAPSTAVTPSA